MQNLFLLGNGNGQQLPSNGVGMGHNQGQPQLGGADGMNHLHLFGNNGVGGTGTNGFPSTDHGGNGNQQQQHQLQQHQLQQLHQQQQQQQQQQQLDLNNVNSLNGGNNGGNFSNGNNNNTNNTSQGGNVFPNHFNNAQGLQQGSSLLSSFPLISQQHQAVAAAQAAAVMAERSLSGVGGNGAPSSAFDRSGFSANHGFDLESNQNAAAAQQLQQQMNAGNLLGGYNASGTFDNSSVLMDTNRLLLQRLQAAQLQNNIPHGNGATNPWGASAFGQNGSFGTGMNMNVNMNLNMGGGAPAGAPACGSNPPHQVGLSAAQLGHDLYTESGLLGPWSSTSAGLLGKFAGLESNPKKKIVRKKPKDKPKRPLSAYNIFFKEERARILASIPSSSNNSKKKSNKQSGGDGIDEDAKEQNDDDNTSTNAKTTATAPTSTSSSGKKKKKVPHGKIGFENLAKIIGQRWQELDGERAAYYKSKAAEDMKRYKAEMEIFLTKQAEKKRAAEEKLSSSSNQDAEDGENSDHNNSSSGKRERLGDDSEQPSSVKRIKKGLVPNEDDLLP